MYVDDIKLAGKKQNLDPMWKILDKEVDLGEPTSFLDHVYFGCIQPIMYILDVFNDKVKKVMILLTVTEPCLNPEFPQKQLKNFLTRKICASLRRPKTWKDMSRNVWNDIVSWQTGRLQPHYKVSTPCIDDHHFKDEELKSVGELSQVCSQIVLKC